MVYFSRRFVRFYIDRLESRHAEVVVDRIDDDENDCYIAKRLI